MSEQIQIRPASQIEITNGNVSFANAAQIIDFAKMMATGGIAIPKHLRDQPGSCMAICMQASEWKMSPFAVANKSYAVNDRLAYEAQLVNAVILSRAPIKGRFVPTYSGEGATRKCKISVACLDGSVAEYESPASGAITVKNSPLWKTDLDQQLFYYSSRGLCRRHFPDVLLGVYTQDELSDDNEIKNASDIRVISDNPFLKKSPDVEIVEAEVIPPMTPEKHRESLLAKIKRDVKAKGLNIKMFPELCVKHELLDEGMLISEAVTAVLEIIAENVDSIIDGSYGGEE